MPNPLREQAKVALDNLGRPGLRDLAERAERGDRALAALSRWQQRDTLTVLRVLAAEGGHGPHAPSPDLARTLDRILRWRLAEAQVTGPWTAVTLTDRGRHLLAGMWAPPLKKGAARG